MPPKKVNSKTPRDLETICLKCLEKEPGRRYDSARELAAELGRFLGDQPISARPAGVMENAWRWSRRNPGMASMGISLIVTLVGALVLLGLLTRQRELSRGVIQSGNSAPNSALFKRPNPTPGPGNRALLSELWAVDGTTFELSKESIGPGRDISVDSKTGNYWAAVLVPTTVSPAGVIIRRGDTDQAIYNVPLVGTNNYCPGSVRVDAIHRVAWVSAECGPGNDPIWVVNADNPGSIKGPISCGGVNASAMVNPATGRYYIDSGGSKRVDPATLAVTKTVFGRVIGVNAASNLLYAQSRSNMLQIINGEPDPEVLVTSIALPFQSLSLPIGIDEAGNRIYLGDSSTNQIHILDGKTGQKLGAIVLNPEIAEIAQVQRVWGVVFDPSRNKLYAVAGKGDLLRYLYVIEEGRPQKAVRIPALASGPEVNPRFNKIYVWAGPEAVD